MEKYNIIHPSLPYNEYKNLIKVSKANGIKVYDGEREFIDGISGLWNMMLGHNNKELLDSIIEQFNKVEFVNPWTSCSQVAYDLATEILRFTNKDFSKVMYTCSGSESIELSIKIARKYQYTKGNIKKKYIAVFDTSYHGTHYGSMSASGVDREFFNAYAPMLQGFTYLKIPFEDNMDIELEYLERFFKVNGDKLAAFLLEPILGVAGVYKVPKRYLDKLKNLCNQYDILIIFDEVSTGFYRTGSKFAYNNVGFVPDMICLSKGINNGILPFGLVLINSVISKEIKADDQIAHFSTQNTNPMCCATALKTIDILKRDNYEIIVRDKSEFLVEVAKEHLMNQSLVKAIRAHGLMMAIELSVDYDFNFVLSISNKIKENGLLTYPYSNKYSSGLLLIPAYICTEEELESMVKIVEATLDMIEE